MNTFLLGRKTVSFLFFPPYFGTNAVCDYIFKMSASHTQTCRPLTRKRRAVLTRLLCLNCLTDYFGVGDVEGDGVGSDGFTGESVGEGVGSDGFVGEGCGDDFGESVGLGATGGFVGSTLGAGVIFGEFVGETFAGGVAVADNFNPATVCGERAAAKMPDNKNKPAPSIKIDFLNIQKSPYLSNFDRRRNTLLCSDSVQ
jgi:hypothetical protein